MEIKKPHVSVRLSPDPVGTGPLLSTVADLNQRLFRFYGNPLINPARAGLSPTRISTFLPQKSSKKLGAGFKERRSTPEN